MIPSTTASCFSKRAVAICSGLGAHAPMWPSREFMRCITRSGPKAQPTRTPVAAKAFDIPSMKMVYGRISGRSETGSTCTVSPRVSAE